MSNSSSKQRRNPLVLLFLVVFVDMIGFGIIIPILPYYGKTFAGDIATVGQFLSLDAPPAGIMIALLFSLYSFMQFIFSPIWGRLSDRVGRRNILLYNLMGSVFGYVLFGLAQTLWFLMLSRIILGIAGGKIATAQAYVADITVPEKRARGMGIIGAGLGLGFVFGPAIAGVLISMEDVVFALPWMETLLLHNIYALPGYFAALISLFNLVLVWKRLPESRRISDATKTRRFTGKGYLKFVLSHTQIRRVIGLIFLVTVAFSGMESMFALWGEASLGITGEINSYLFAYIGVLIAVNQGMLVGRLADWVGEKKLVIIGITSMAIGLIFIPMAGSIPVLMVVLVFLAFGSGVNTPSLQSLVSRFAVKEEVGGVLGVSQSASSLARILGPLIGGWVYDTLSIGAPFYMAAGLMAIALLLGIQLNRGSHKDVKESV